MHRQAGEMKIETEHFISFSFLKHLLSWLSRMLISITKRNDEKYDIMRPASYQYKSHSKPPLSDGFPYKNILFF